METRNPIHGRHPDIQRPRLGHEGSTWSTCHISLSNLDGEYDQPPSGMARSTARSLPSLHCKGERTSTSEIHFRRPSFEVSHSAHQHTLTRGLQPCATTHAQGRPTRGGGQEANEKTETGSDGTATIVTSEIRVEIAVVSVGTARARGGIVGATAAIGTEVETDRGTGVRGERVAAAEIVTGIDHETATATARTDLETDPETDHVETAGTVPHLSSISANWA